MEEYDCPLPCGLRPIHYTPLHPYTPNPTWAHYNARMHAQFVGLQSQPKATRRRRMPPPTPLPTPQPLARRTSTIATMLGRTLPEDQAARILAHRKQAHNEQVAKRRKLNPVDHLAHTVRIDTILAPAAPSPSQPPSSPPFGPLFTDAMYANYFSGDSSADSDFDSDCTSACSFSSDDWDDSSPDAYSCTNVHIPLHSRIPSTTLGFANPFFLPLLPDTHVSLGRGSKRDLHLSPTTHRKKHKHTQ